MHVPNGGRGESCTWHFHGCAISFSVVSVGLDMVLVHRQQQQHQRRRYYRWNHFATAVWSLGAQS